MYPKLCRMFRSGGIKLTLPRQTNNSVVQRKFQNRLDSVPKRWKRSIRDTNRQTSLWQQPFSLQGPYPSDITVTTTISTATYACTFRHDSVMLIICLLSQFSHPLTAQLYAFWLNQSSSFSVNWFFGSMFLALALNSAAFFAATIHLLTFTGNTNFKMTT